MKGENVAKDDVIEIDGNVIEALQMLLLRLSLIISILSYVISQAK